MTALNKQALREELEICSKDRMRRISLALLDELEATQKTSEARRNAILRTHNMFRKQRWRAEAAEKRIAELEARKVAVKQFDDFQIVHYGATEDYAKGYIDCQNNYNKALAAAGIGVKGE
ncbi:hypothetical protein KAM22_002528 [Salmonella enterica subsp. enterica serovar Matopeni]|nr:hypothetical protein [Salmonella enterica subsp. enterica]EHR2122152.1 hypothetical protein [Salmonella enterica subsp. enterica serovar Matopeni]